jgi:hypothetical protein
VNIATTNVALDSAVRKELRAMSIAGNVRNIYPALHAVATKTEWPDYAEAVGCVFRLVCDAIGFEYGREYMDAVINARFEDGTLMPLLRDL